MLAGFSLHDTAGKKRVSEACDAVGLSPALWAAFLETRARHIGSGNRRRMFAAFDRFFDEGPDERASTGEPTQTRTNGDRIVLTRLAFKNWKVFQNANFVFPRYEAERQVVLIGGKNGYGKTSLLEGLLHGLFGRDADIDLDRNAAGGAPSGAARAQAYRHTLERALHRSAKDRGDSVMLVRSEWQTDDGELIVERRWYFDQDGKLVEDDEGLNLWIGPDKEVLVVPEGEDAVVFYQSEIARRLMPASLAAFVLFDGEQVKRFAQRDFAEQVRVAVETVLGLTVWRDAIADLRAYARDRSKGAVRNEEFDRAVDEAVTDLKTAENAALAEIETVNLAAAPLRVKRDTVLERLGALGGRTYATMQEMLERRQTLGAEHARALHELATLASSELPLLIVGADLRSKLQASLQADQASGTTQEVWADATALEQLVMRMRDELGGPEHDIVEDALRKAWRALSIQPKVETRRRHSYLAPSTRGAVLERLTEAASGKETAVNDLARRIQTLADERTALDHAIADHELQELAVTELKSELEVVTRELDGLDDIRRALDQTLGRIQGDLREKSEAAETRLVARMSDSQMISRRRAALDLAHRGEVLIDQLKPDCFDAVGEAVTRAYCALAHKGLVSRIIIDPDGRVILMDELGTDIRAVEASAGESQIFAMALMAAVAELSGRRLPSIIDTPLGRLDSDHRRRVLSFFTSRDVQTILLSQPDEVNEHYLSLIEDKIAARFHLDHIRLSGGPGGSVPMEGYFPEIAA